MGDSEIREWAQSGENIDIYQLNAIYEGSGDRKTVCFTYIKTFACFGLQTFGIITLMQLQWKAAGYECANITTNDVCNGNFSTEGWIAFFFAMFVSITIGEQIRTLGDYGMYKWGSDQPGSVSRFWVAVGFITNILVLLLTWVCSTITIMSSKTLDVIVLNSVAVLFMVVLDDEIVSFADYSQIPNALGQGSVSRICQACDIVGGLLLKIQLLWKIPYVCSILMFILTVVVPIGVLACYNDEIIMHPTCCITGTLKELAALTDCVATP